jgi:predicted LPLAT superfamily acyltransferase
MHEAFRKRLQVLEKAAALREAPPHLISVGFAGVEPTVAWTGDFKCWRLEGEDEDGFVARAHAECRAADPRPVQILFFSDDPKPSHEEIS